MNLKVQCALISYYKCQSDPETHTKRQATQQGCLPSLLGDGDKGIERVIQARQAQLSNRGLQFYTFFGISIGITRRMIDIGKKITFYFLKNV